MARCEAIKADGTRCKVGATRGYSWCWNHNPETAAARRANATRGGKTGGRGRPIGGSEEITSIKADLSRIVAEVEAGNMERGRAAVIGQLFNILLRSIEVERRIAEADQLGELAERLERLESRFGGGTTWRA